MKKIKFLRIKRGAYLILAMQLKYDQGYSFDTMLQNERVVVYNWSKGRERIKVIEPVK